MKHRYLLMELIGNDLDDLKDKTKNGFFSIKSVLMVGLQAIDRLEALHKIGYLHRDVKPDNLAIGIAQKSKIIYLFDFGLALPIGNGVPKEEKGKVVGTLGFMSLRAHEGKNLGPSDDIESLVYTLLYLAEGTLPWIKLKVQSPADFHKIMMSKKGISKKGFKNEFIPHQLFQLMSFVQGMRSTDKVDYLKIKYKLLEALKRKNQLNDFAFDWCNHSARKVSPEVQNKKKNYSPEDTGRKKKEKMNQENQQIVQNDIYQVYKFMEKEKKVASKDKKQVPKKISPKKQPKIQFKPVKARPVSAVPRPKPKQQQKPLAPWDKIKQFQQTYSGVVPKIVINKTAKHKI